VLFEREGERRLTVRLVQHAAEVVAVGCAEVGETRWKAPPERVLNACQGDELCQALGLICEVRLIGVGTRAIPPRIEEPKQIVLGGVHTLLKILPCSTALKRDLYGTDRPQRTLPRRVPNTTKEIGAYREDEVGVRLDAACDLGPLLRRQRTRCCGQPAKRRLDRAHSLGDLVGINISVSKSRFLHPDEDSAAVGPRGNEGNQKKPRKGESSDRVQTMARQPSVEERRAHLERFVGREEVVSAIDHHLQNETRWILVRGAPGIGKTALLTFYLDRLETVGVVAALDDVVNRVLGRSKTPLDGRPINIVATRLVTKKRDNRRVVPHAFLHRTATRRERSREIALLLARQVEQIFPELADREGASASWYLSHLLNRASELLVASKQRLVIVIDGLDACADDLKPVNPMSYRLPSVPANISVVCSSRALPDEDLRWMMESGSFASIDLDSPEWFESNRDVCIRFVEKVQAELPPHVTLERAVAAANGCVRYLVDLAHTLREHPAAPLDRVPHSFRTYLDQIWDRLHGLPDDLRGIVRSGFEVLATESEPVPPSEIGSRAGWEVPGAAEVFTRLARPFVVAKPQDTEPAFRLFHPAFAQYIAETIVLERSLPTLRVRGQLDRVSKSLPAVKRVASRYFLGVGADDYLEQGIRCMKDVLGECERAGRLVGWTRGAQRGGGCWSGAGGTVRGPYSLAS